MPSQGIAFNLSIRCPACKQRGTFEALGGVGDVYLTGNTPYVIVGHRRCPNTECHTHLFFAAQDNNVVVSYPAERIDFDSTNVPTAVVEALEEAITCHANQCFIAAAIMVRKSLEELCRDRGATGPKHRYSTPTITAAWTRSL